VKNPAVLLVSLFFATGAFAQAPAGGSAQGPVQVAQAAGGSSSGAAVPAATTGATSTVAALVAVGVAGVAAAVGYSSTATNH
jgi:hypothetical protein